VSTRQNWPFVGKKSLRLLTFFKPIITTAFLSLFFGRLILIIWPFWAWWTENASLMVFIFEPRFDWILWHAAVYLGVSPKYCLSLPFFFFWCYWPFVEAVQPFSYGRSVQTFGSNR